MVIEVLFADLVDVRFFFGSLPLSLKEEIGLRKAAMWEGLCRIPISAVGRFYRTMVPAEDANYFVTARPGKSYLAEDGTRVQEIWILKIQEAAKERE